MLSAIVSRRVMACGHLSVRRCASATPQPSRHTPQPNHPVLSTEIIYAITWIFSGLNIKLESKEHSIKELHHYWDIFESKNNGFIMSERNFWEKYIFIQFQEYISFPTNEITGIPCPPVQIPHALGIKYLMPFGKYPMPLG